VLVNEKAVEKQEESAQEETEPKATTFLSSQSSDPCAAPDLTDLMTQFLSLDKCLPRKEYLSIVHVPVDERKPSPKLEYDLEWLAVLRKTHSLTSTERRRVNIPSQLEAATEQEMNWVRERLGNSLEIPDNFYRTVPAHAGPTHPVPMVLPPPFPAMGNPQTDRLLDLLQLEHVLTIPFRQGEGLPAARVAPTEPVVDENELDIDDEDDANMKDENEVDIDDAEDGEGTYAGFVLDYGGNDSGTPDPNKKPRVES
jgi:lariat debranching enzyme